MKIFPFIYYLRQNVLIVFAAFVFAPLGIAFVCWLMGSDIKSASVTALACILWMFVSQYGNFEVVTKKSEPITLADFFKKELIGVSMALVSGYLIFLLFSSIAVSPFPIGNSYGYFFAATSVLLYYQGRYMGFNNGLPILKKLFVWLGLPVPPTDR